MIFRVINNQNRNIAAFRIKAQRRTDTKTVKAIRHEADDDEINIAFSRAYRFRGVSYSHDVMLLKRFGELLRPAHMVINNHDTAGFFINFLNNGA